MPPLLTSCAAPAYVLPCCSRRWSSPAKRRRSGEASSEPPSASEPTCGCQQLKSSGSNSKLPVIANIKLPQHVKCTAHKTMPKRRTSSQYAGGTTRPLPSHRFFFCCFFILVAMATGRRATKAAVRSADACSRRVSTLEGGSGSGGGGGGGGGACAACNQACRICNVHRCIYAMTGRAHRRYRRAASTPSCLVCLPLQPPAAPMCRP